MNRFKSKIKDEHNLILLSEYNCIRKLTSIAYEDGAFNIMETLETLHDNLLLEFGKRFITEYEKNKRID